MEKTAVLCIWNDEANLGNKASLSFYSRFRYMTTLSDLKKGVYGILVFK